MDRQAAPPGQTEACSPLNVEQQYSPSSYTLGIPAFAPPNYYVSSPTKKFDPTKIPSKIYTEYAKPVYLSDAPRQPETSPSPKNHTGVTMSPEKGLSKAPAGKYIVPTNIQSYLENNEPIYQNENPHKIYELMTPQKFTKANSVSTKPPEPIKSPYAPKTTKSSESSLPVPSSPDVKEEKKKKWTLGGLFRRRKKESDTESSSQDEEPRKGFLARRRSRREKRKQRANKSTTGFDHIVKPPDKRDPSKEGARPAGLSPENTMSADSLTKSPGTEALRAKGLSKDSLVGSHDQLSSRSSRHQDSSLSRNSSGGSGSLEGLSRRERLGVIKARAEALRQKGSSSDEDPNSVSNSLHRSGSVNRRSRYARTERYIKRLSRDEESILHREAMEKQRLCKSDAEGPFAVTNRWLPAGQEGSDCDPRYNVTSATPSPGQSPLVRHKNVHYTNSAPLTSVSNPGSLDRKCYQSQSVRGSKCYSVRGQSPLPPSCDQKLPQRHPSFENFQYPGQRSFSYDNNIHRVANVGTPPASENVMVVQFPLGRISQFQPRVGDPAARNSVFVSGKPGPPPPPPRDPQRLITSSNCLLPENTRPMSYAFEDGSQGLHPGFGSGPKQHGSFISLNNQPGAAPMTAGARSNSENQIMGQTNSFPRPQPRPRPSSVTPEAMKPLPGGRYNILDTPFKSQFQYYADQTPRSRKPIHIQYHPDQPYLSDSQVVLMKPPQPRNHPVSQVTEFWRQKEQDNNVNNVKIRRNSGIRLPRSDRSRSPSPHLKDSQESPRFKHRGLVPIRPTDSLSSLSGHSDVSSPLKSSDVHDSYESLAGPHNSDSLRRKDQRPLSMVLESQEQMSLANDHGVAVSHSDVTPKMRFLQEVLPNKGTTYGNMTKLRPVQENTPNTRAAMDGLPRTRSTPESVPKTRMNQKLFTRAVSVQDTKPEPSQDSLSKNKPLESGVPKFMIPVQDYSSTSPKNKSALNEASPKMQTLFQESQVSTLLSSKNAPPTPPVRRFSRQLSNSSMEAVEMAEIDLEPRARRSSNLEDALDELEAIYQSLKLGDEDLLDRAERRDLPTQFQRRDSIQDSFRGGLTRGSMSDSGYNYEMPFVEVRKRAPPVRRSGVPDKVTDDMAYRRLHPKDRPNSQNIISQAGSFILASPALSQASSMNQGLDQAHLKTSSQEPDTTFDDVVYRNIRHVNNSLKCLDPQPPFGIPLGPVTPAPDSDYLHAKPTLRYRPTFKPRRTPDVVGDDLAYRNLRKDNPKDTALPSVEDVALNTARLKDNNFSLRRRRAVRSLSANLPSLIGRDNLTIINVNVSDRDFEKAQSMTHLPDALEIAQKILEGKEVIGGGPSLLTHAQLDACRRGERVSNVDRNSLCTTSTSTETLTDSRANLTLFQDSVNKRNSWQQKLRVNIPTNEPNLQRPPPPSTPERRNLDENLLPPSSANSSNKSLDRLSNLAEKNGSVLEVVSTSVVNGSLPVPDTLPGSPLDEGQLEDLLSALAREARVTSKQLGIQLAGLKKPSTSSIHHVHGDVTLEGVEDSRDAPVNNVSAENIDETKFVIEPLHIYEPNDVKEIDGSAKTEVTMDVKCAEKESDVLSQNTNVYQKASEIHFKLVKDEEEDIMPDSLTTWEENNNVMTDDSLNVGYEPESMADTINKMLSESRERNHELPDTFPLKPKTSNTDANNASPSGTEALHTAAVTNTEDSGISAVKLEEVHEEEIKAQHVTATQTGRVVAEEEEKKSEARNGTGISVIMSKSDGAAGKSDRQQYTSSEGECSGDELPGRPVHLQSLPVPCSIRQRRTRDSDLTDSRRADSTSMSDRRSKLASRSSGLSTSGSSDNCMVPPVENQRQRDERIARYKEERRKQLASQFASINEPPSATKRYITRSVTARSNDDPSAERGATPSSKSNESSSESGSKVRTTRTSRLRAATASDAPPSAPSSSPRKISTPSKDRPSSAKSKSSSDNTTPGSSPRKDPSKSRMSPARSRETDLNLKLPSSTNPSPVASPRKTSISRLAVRSKEDAPQRKTSHSGSPQRKLSNLDVPQRKLSHPGSPQRKISAGSRVSPARSVESAGSTGSLKRSPRHGSPKIQTTSRVSPARSTESAGSTGSLKRSSRHGSPKIIPITNGSPREAGRSSSRGTDQGVTNSRRGSVGGGMKLTTSSAGTGSSDKEKSPLSSGGSSTNLTSPRPEKDKSSKRKSNLNRALSTEEVEARNPDDSAIRRRPRRVDSSPSIVPPSYASPLSSPRTSLYTRKSPEHTPRGPDNLLSASKGAFDVFKREKTSPPKAFIKDLSSQKSASRLRGSPDRTTKKTDYVSKTGQDSRHNSRIGNNVPNERGEPDVYEKVDLLTAITRQTVERLEKLTEQGAKSSLVNGETLEGSSSKPAGESHKVGNTTMKYPSPIEEVGPLDFLVVESCEIFKPSKPSSILKKTSFDESQYEAKAPPPVPMPSQLPVSILKRKTSHEESAGSAPSPPVTFSPTVIEQTRGRNNQGILKKRCSLDESEVLRRRSCSPDVNNESKPILKRRSSLEELVRRAQSPDPQSILKRRTSRDDDLDERSSSPEPHGILKRKMATATPPTHHISIATSVLMSVAGMDPTEYDSDHVRPILKKKSSSEDYTTADSSSDTPKPILKKKTSVDTDDQEDRPKKTILKTSRKSSQEESYANGGESGWQNGGRDCESPGRYQGETRYSTSFRDVESPVRFQASRSTNERYPGADRDEGRYLGTHRDTGVRDRDSPKRFDASDKEGRYLKSTSPKLQTANATEGSYLKNRPIADDSPSSSDCEIKPILKNSTERCSKERSVSPKHRLSFTDEDKDEKRLAIDGVVLRRRIKSSDNESTSSMDNELQTIFNRRRSQETSPVSFEEGMGEPRTLPVAEDRPPQRPLSVAERIQNMEHFLHVESETLTPTGAVPKRSTPLRGRDKARFSTQPITRNDFHGITVKNDLENAESKSAHLLSNSSTSPNKFLFLNNDSVVGRQEPQRPSSRGPETDATTMDADEDDEHALRKSGSVTAKTSMFSKMQEQMKAMAEEAQARRKQKSVNKGIARHRERGVEKDEARFQTQPVTLDEVQQAVLLNQKQNETLDADMPQDPTDDEADPSKLSLAERVRLFNRKSQEEQPVVLLHVARKRAARFKTQPVTMEEIDTAQRISPLAATFIKPPHPELLGTMSARAAKEKMFEHAQQNLKSILKPGSPAVRNKTPELDGLRHLKSVLKKETSVDDPPPSESEPPRSILKPESTEFASDHRSSTSEEESSDSDAGEPDAKRHDLVSILHDVEAAHAKHKTADNNRNRSPEEEKARNQKNIDHQEKENLKNINQKVITETPTPKKRGDDGRIKASLIKKELEQKLMPKRVIEELNRNRKNVAGTEQRNDVDARKTQSPTAFDERKKKLGDVLRVCEDLSSSADTGTSDGESSGGREVRRIIRNEAVAKRRQAAINKHKDRNSASLVSLSKSYSQTTVITSRSAQEVSCADDDPGSFPGDALPLRRSMTQPMGDLQEDSVKGNASIAERLAALKKSGTTNWQKRVPKLKAEDDLTVVTVNNLLNVELRPHSDDSERILVLERVHQKEKSPTPLLRCDSPGEESTLVADRRGKLETATQGWKKRVGPTDAVNFSVHGRMLKESKADLVASPLASPLLSQTERQKKTPTANRFRSKTARADDVKSTPTSPQKAPKEALSFKRSVSAPGGEEENGLSLDDSMTKVCVPRFNDETYTTFFQSVTESVSTDTTTEIRDEDLEHLESQSSQLLIQRRTVKKATRKAASGNPMKTLAARTDLQEEYVQIKTGVAEKELRKMKVEQFSKQSTLAIEALAGLASTEDFTAVSLKKAGSPYGSAMLPFKELMLLQIKGRRHVQTRLVEPCAASINSGDNYVLVTPTEVYNWIGLYSNVIERSRGAEIASLIQQRKDLGCSTNSVITITQGKVTCPKSKVDAFWKHLKGTSAEPVAAGHPDEDELYESSIIDTNMIYEVIDQELIPIDDYWGAIPKIEMLDPSKVLVFDFGSELYVWSGKNASMDKRKVGVSLANELWEEGYDYAECDICPVTAAKELGSRTEIVSSKCGQRPSWALLAKVNQHMETVVFREKFLDWPDFSRVIQAKGGDESERQAEGSIEVKPCDAKEMYETRLPQPDLELEGSHVGRGTQYVDELTSRHMEITTQSVSVWHILEYEHTRLPAASHGQFHSADSYVVRWLYTITVTGRELSGQPSRHSMIGRDRCAYFCWQGSDASLNEQGAAALLTVELDHERGPQVRVVQGSEPSAFLNLFQGGMVVHAGQRYEERKGSWRLYMCRGETENEAVLVEVACSVRQLRSRASLILLHTITGVLYVWHGSKAQAHTKKVAKSAAEKLKHGHPEEMGFDVNTKITIKEIIEGEEMNDFLEGLGGGKGQLYHSLCNESKSFNHTPRLFHLSSVSGCFASTEIATPYRTDKVTVAFPFLQSDLYSANQPTLFLLDNGSELWLWQGWWPEREDVGESGIDATGSGSVRWQAERRAAMQTAMDYWKLSRKGKPKAFLVWAGLEPLTFTNLFPMWIDRDDIAELNIRDGRKPGEVLMVECELARLTRSTYPAAQLLQRPLPDGVDPTRLELYLDPQHFQELLGTTKEEFEELPTWKQTKIKKEAGLF